MSTRSNIAILLRPEDRNKTFKTPWGKSVNPNGEKFLVVYCHNDGDPSGVGADLESMFNGGNYEDALEYILRGDRSTTDLSYYEWRGEKCPPRAYDKASDCYQEDYLYIMYEVDGKIAVVNYDDIDESMFDTL